MIWKALSDPTRRSILNLLKTAPRTTGEISDYFQKNLSRFAVMKHLGVLEKADLIKVKRKGKYRWNHLNPKPIEKTYEQWVSQLIQLKFLTESTSQKMGDTEIHTTKVSVETNLIASKERVWKAFTTEIDRWWIKDFYVNPKTQRFVLDAKLGGLMYEDAGNDEGLVWATVIGIDQPNNLILKGQLSPKLGGPAISFVNIFLEESKENTVLQLSEVILGNISSNLQSDISTRWKQLLEKGLKPFVEAN